MATSKNYNVGELRTPVIIEDGVSEVSGNNRATVVWHNIFGEGKSVSCKWIPTGYKDSYNAQVNDRDKTYMLETALLVLRYSPLITRTCRILRPGEPVPYTVISAENIAERGLWLELRVSREVNRR